MRRLSVLLAILLCSTVAHAQAQATANGTALARFHFTAGVEHAARGELEAALHDFEAAYAAQPHYSVLYNIGQAQAALGKPVQALHTFERYRTEAGARLSQARLDELRTLLDDVRKNVGELRLTVTSPSTRVWLDGSELEAGALAKPISVALGSHSLLFSDAAGPPLTQTVLVKSGSTAEVTLATPPRPAPAGYLNVSCNLPGINVEIDGARVATTPLADPLLVAAGPRSVRFSRPGYRDVVRPVVASSTQPARVVCSLSQNPTLLPEVAGALQVQTNPADAVLFVDGERFLGATLPMGPHELRVEHDDFVSSTKPIWIRAGSTVNYAVTLQPTRAHQARQTRAAARRQTFGYVGLGGGLALVAGGIGLFAWNGGRYSDWQHNREADGYGRQLEQVSSIQRIDDVAIASLALGGGLVAAGAWLLLTPPSPE